MSSSTTVDQRHGGGHSSNNSRDSGNTRKHANGGERDANDSNGGGSSGEYRESVICNAIPYTRFPSTLSSASVKSGKGVAQSGVGVTLTVAAATHIGSRRNQEDRLLLVPDLYNNEFALLCVFDGTVREFASEFVHRHFAQCLCDDPSFQAFCRLPASEKLPTPLSPVQRQQHQQQQRHSAVASQPTASYKSMGKVGGPAVGDKVPKSHGFDRLHDADASDTANPHYALLDKALTDTFAVVDHHLLAYIQQHGLGNSTCTGVVCLIYKPARVMWTAHVGDSHVAVGYGSREQAAVNGADAAADAATAAASPSAATITKGDVAFAPSLLAACGADVAAARHWRGELLTFGHKADTPFEQHRVAQAGGCLHYLHRTKPFLRRRDDHRWHHTRGQLELNYSRAFGGTALKRYGLVCEPDIRRVSLAAHTPSFHHRHELADDNGEDDKPAVAQQQQKQTSVIVVGSDGVWDVVSPSTAVRTATTSIAAHAAYVSNASQKQQQQKPLSAAEDIVNLALHNHEVCHSSDNVTAVVCVLEYD